MRELEQIKNEKEVSKAEEKVKLTSEKIHNLK